MKDLANYKSTNRTNIIPINRTTKTETPLVISAINQVIADFDFKSEQSKREILGKLIYRINLLDLQENELVFEIGTGSGLQAAVMAAMGVKVMTVSSDKTSAQQSFNGLNTSFLNSISVYSLDDISAAGKKAPFDKIIVSAEASNLPVELYALLSINGKMLISSNDGNKPTILEVSRTSDETFDVKRKTGLVDKSTSYEVFDL